MSEYRLWPATDGPSSQAADTDDYSLGVEFYVTASAVDITEIHFWASTNLAGTYTGRVYSVDAGGTTGSAVAGTDVTFGSITGPGWNTATLAAPVTLTINQRYRAVVAFTTANGYTSTSGYWNSSGGGGGAAGIVNGPLTAPNADNAEGNRQGSFNAATGLAFPGSQFNQTNYWVDVTVDDGLPPTGVATLPLGGLTLRAGGGYSNTYGDIYLPEVTVTRPASASLPLGSLTLAALSAAAPPAADPDTDGLNMSLWAVGSTGALTPLPHFVNLVLSRERNGIGRIAVDYPYYGRNFDLLAANVTNDRDLEVEIWVSGKRAGALRGILTDTAGDDVAEDAVWRFEGHFLELLLDEVLVWPQSGAEKQEMIFSGANAGSIAATILTQAQARGGLVGATRDFTTSVDSSGNAWTSTASMTFAPSVTYLEVLQELVELGMIDGFEFTAGRVLRMWAPGEQGTDLTVTGAPIEYRLWPATDGPATNEVDATDYTLGVEFYVTEAAILTEVHYWWNGTGADTDHAWRLWEVTGTGDNEADGTLVDSGGAFGPMADGWTTATLSTPVTLTANSRYRMGVYFTTNNGYTRTSSYWSSGAGAAGRTNGILVAPSSAVAGGGRQGSYNATAGNFPYQVASASNYWIDVTVESLTVPPPPPVFRRGRNLTSSPRRHTVRNSGTTSLVAGSENLYASTHNSTAFARRGRRIEIAGSANSLKDIGSVGAYATSMALQISPGTQEVTHGIVFGDGHPRPLIDFFGADWVWSDTRGDLERLRVWQIELELGPDGYAGTVVLNTPITDRMVALARKLKRMSSGTAVIGTSTTTVDPEVDDGKNPAQVVGVTASSDAYFTAEGDTLASVQAGWSAVTTNSDGSAADDIVGYFPAYRYTGTGMPDAWQVLPQVAASPTDWSGLIPDQAIQVRVAAVDRWGHVGAWSAAYALTTGADATPPPTPSTPVVDSYLGILTVAWEGLGSAAEAQPVDFDRVDVHVSTSSGFTPGPASKIDSLRRAGTVAWDGGTYGVTYYSKLVAYDKTGNASAASAQDSAVLAQAADGDISALSIGKLSAGIMSAIMTLSGIIRTASSGDRVEIDSDGIHCYDGTDLVFDFDISAGTVYVRGTMEAYQSATDRIQIQPSGAGASGVSTAEISLWAQSTSPAYINAFDAGSGRTGAGINSGNSADSGTTRRQTTLQLRPSHFILFYNSAPGDSAGASANRGARVYGDNDEVSVSLYDSSGLRISGVDVQDDEVTGQVFDGSGVREGGYFWLRRAVGDTYFGHFDGDVDTYLRFGGDGDVVLRRDTNQFLTMSGSSTEVRHASGIRLTMNSSDTILGQGGNTYIKLNNSGNLEFFEGGSGYSSLSALKSFVIDHPTDPDRLLVHVCTESPTAGVEYTGSVEVVGGRAEVVLPDYFEALTEITGRTVQLTPVDELCLVAASPVVDGRFAVKCSGPDGTLVDWHVRATRRRAGFDVEPLRGDVNVRGSGPYRYIQPRQGAEQ